MINLLITGIVAGVVAGIVVGLIVLFIYSKKEKHKQVNEVPEDVFPGITQEMINKVLKKGLNVNTTMSPKDFEEEFNNTLAEFEKMMEKPDDQ